MLYTETDGLLIDAGVGIRTLKKHFLDYGLKMQQVRNIIITHDHADHVKSVGKMSTDCNLPVYATEEVHKGIERNYCVRKKIAPINKKIIQKNEPFQLGDFRITAFNVPHDSADNVGYRIEAEGIVFCLMTDAGHVTDEMKQYISEANYLVIEANHDTEMLFNGPYPDYLKERVNGLTGHLSNRACGDALVENATPRMQHVWLCHLSQENNHPELARKTVQMILQNSGIIVGKDFGLDVLKRRTPSDIFQLT